MGKRLQILPLRTSRLDFTYKRATVSHGREWASKKNPSEVMRGCCGRHDIFLCLGDNLLDIYRKEGYSAVAPMIVPNWTIVKSERFSYASSWSERHAAYAAGLGTLVCVMDLLPLKVKQCERDLLLQKYLSSQRHAPIQIITLIVSFIQMEPAANVLIVVLPEPLQSLVMIKKNADNTWCYPENM